MMYGIWKQMLACDRNDSASGCVKVISMWLITGLDAWVWGPSIGVGVLPRWASHCKFCPLAVLSANRQERHTRATRSIECGHCKIASNHDHHPPEIFCNHSYTFSTTKLLGSCQLLHSSLMFFNGSIVGHRESLLLHSQSVSVRL